jgi:hypothetical protein
MPWVCEFCENPCYIIMPLESVAPNMCILGDEKDCAVAEWQYKTYCEAMDGLTKWWKDMNIPLRIKMEKKV